MGCGNSCKSYWHESGGDDSNPVSYTHLEEAQKLIQAGKRETLSEKIKPPAMPEKIQREAEPAQILDFRVYVNRSQMMALKQFLKENGIRFRCV